MFIEIEKGQADFDNLKWCEKARNQKHPLAQFMYKDGEYIIATDRHRLHVIKIINIDIFKKIDECFLSVIEANSKYIVLNMIDKNSEDAPGVFPNWKYVLPEEVKIEDVISSFAFTCKDQNYGWSKIYAKIFNRLGDTNHFVNMKFLDDVLFENAQISVFNGGRSLYFVNEDETRQAVIATIQKLKD